MNDPVENQQDEEASPGEILSDSSKLQELTNILLNKGITISKAVDVAAGDESMEVVEEAPLLSHSLFGFDGELVA